MGFYRVFGLKGNLVCVQEDKTKKPQRIRNTPLRFFLGLLTMRLCLIVLNIYGIDLTLSQVMKRTSA
ncbi:hypothetical protein HMPREF0454_00649 [Hafnia alvei ATCC 51873]|uniref:Uncharacterized protein n=1 Tax=Hafnia alvei ATCC 51873 TaxID=1002364 RepID=G9Y237_HAFAL|nr:hypothetical protein HMPREF0454_00649 [Hafnia alvei ATCC 51873]